MSGWFLNTDILDSDISCSQNYLLIEIVE